MRSRFVTNLLALVVIGAGFFGITAVLNLIGAKEELKKHEFSYLKRTADQHWQDKNWKEAARYYKELADSDELNSGAQLAYAWNLSQQITSAIRKARHEELAELPESAKELIREAVTAYRETIHSTQFRNISRVQLGWLHGLLGQNEQAIPYIVAAIEDGYQVKNLRNDFSHRSLMDDPRVQEAVRKASGIQ